MSANTIKFDTMCELNFRKATNSYSNEQFGNMETYRKRPSASKISQGCPYKVVQEAKNPTNHSLEQLIVFRRGHIGEQIVEDMFYGMKILKQYKILSEFDGEPIEANADFVIKSDKRIVVVEAKTVSAPISEPYESWILQVQFQMGLLLEQNNFDKDVEAYIVAIDLNTGWHKSFNIKFDSNLFDVCLGKTQHLIDCFRGNCEPKAVVQHYCGTCSFKMSCPKQGLHAQKAPETLVEDIKFVKKFKEMEKEAKLREKRIKEGMVNLGLNQISNLETSSVATVKEIETTRFDMERFKIDYPDLYKQYQKSSSSFKMTMI